MDTIMQIYLDHGGTNPISYIFSCVTYNKAGSVLHMLRQVLDEEIFFASLNQYAWDNADQSVITDDFQNAIEEVSGEDLGWSFDQWIYGPGHPQYETGWKSVPLRGILTSNLNHKKITPVTPVTPVPLRGIRICILNYKKIIPVTRLSSENPAPTYEIEFAIAQTQDQSKHYYPFRMSMEIGLYHDGVEEIFAFTDSIGYQRFSIEVD